MHSSSRPADERFQRSTFQKTDTILSCIVHAHVKGMFPTKQYIALITRFLLKWETDRKKKEIVRGDLRRMPFRS